MAIQVSLEDFLAFAHLSLLASPIIIKIAPMLKYTILNGRRDSIVSHTVPKGRNIIPNVKNVL